MDDTLVTLSGGHPANTLEPSRERKRPVDGCPGFAQTPVAGARGSDGATRRQRFRSTASRRRGYVLLENTVATGLLIVGLAVIGSQVQSADLSVKKMERKLQAILLSE